MRQPAIVLMILMLGGAAPAQAQSPYVGVSLTGDFLWVNHSESSGDDDLLGSGQAIGFALRVGTPIGSNWGVDMEFARPSKIENDGRPDIFPLADPLASNIVGGQLAALIYPPISYQLRTSQRNTTFSTAIWVRQEVSRRLALAYSGGLGFHRTERAFESSYVIAAGLPATSPIFVPPQRSRTETVTYTARPVVGLDAWIRMTDQLKLVPGARMHGLENGLLSRPSIGLVWTF